jgi:hypothetical protein
LLLLYISHILIEGGTQEFMIVNHDHSEERPDTKEIRESYSGLFQTHLVSEWINHKTTPFELSEYDSIHPTLIKHWKSILLKEAKQSESSR